MPRNAISLFSGMGGDSVGLKQAGWNVIAFNEFWDEAVETHQLNLPGKFIEGDIREIPDSVWESYRGKVDLVFAGFPCQGFSHAGKKNPNDKRNELVYEFARVVRLIQPRYMIGENVEGLLSRKAPDGTPVIEIIRSIFKDIGYTFNEHVVNSADVGVPQTRKRLLLVGERGDTAPTIVLPSLSHVGIRSILCDSLEVGMEVDTFPESTTQFPKRQTIVSGTAHHWFVKSVSEGKVSAGKRISPHHVEVLHLDKPCKTIICSYERQPRLFVALENSTTKKKYIRMLLPDELKQIQGFPKDYVVAGNVKEQIIQIGNAVAPPVARCIAEQLVKLFCE